MHLQQILTENILKNVVESAALPIGVYAGHDLKIVLANKYMRDTWGKGDDVIGKFYTEILPELENQEIFGHLREVLATGIPFHAKNTKVDIIKDGKLMPHYFNYNFTPVYDDNGNLFAVMNTASEVTELHDSRQQTVEAEEHLRIAVQSADLGTFETRGEAIIASQRFRQIWEVDEDQCTQSGLINRIHTDDLPVRDLAYEKAEYTGQLNYEVRILVQDGATKWIRLNGTILKSEDGKATSVIGIVQDVTEQKLFAEKLRKLVKKRTRALKRSNEDLLQFAHVVSHDLKEPVRKIKIFNNLLQSELQPVLEEKSKQYLEKVQHASDRIFMMIDGILNYSALNASGNPVEKVDLNQVIENITNDLEVVIQQKNAHITVEIIPDIEGSPILMHQLFYNLINNALKFSKEDIPPRIDISCVKQDGVIELIVKDNGIGIDDKYSQRVFNAFERLHSKDRYEGTGLGLSLCKKITERHHG
ncbi:PAS domain-containing sensor histidine kinase, partial [Mucilaginibacter polytrichastri]